MTDKSCPICGRTVNHAQWEGTKDTVLFDCPRCGTYEMPGLQRATIPSWFREKPDLSPVLSHYIRVRNRTEKWPMIGKAAAEWIEANPSLPTPAQQADNLVLFLGDSLRAAGEVVALDEPVHGAIIGSRNGEEVRFIVRALKQRGLIEAPNEARLLDVTLSLAGWDRLEQLRKAAAAPESRAIGEVRGGAGASVASQPPRAFISHASEDKERFVVKFAERLLAKGVKAWLDQWEMLPGDSLVSKIFDHGIAQADCVIVVLSHNSVAKRWVREELDAAIVRSIKENIRVIPLLIEDCEVPEALSAKVWLRIADLANYDSEFERLLAAIFQHRARPPLGPPPAYAAGRIAIDGLESQDALVLAEVCRALIDQQKTNVSPAELLPRLEPQGLDIGRVTESLEVLGEDGLVNITRGLGVGLHYCRVTPRGVRAFATATIDVPKLESEILSLVINKDMKRSSEIAAATNQPEVVIHALLHGPALSGLEVKDYRDSNAPQGRRTEVISVSPRLRRRLG